MTDEKKKPEEDEVGEEQLEGVAGGATAPKVQQSISQTKQEDIASTPLANFVSDHTTDTASLDGMATVGDED